MSFEVASEADFQVLGLQPGSTPSEVRRAYRDLVKKWHPDRHHSKPYETRALAEKKFREIDEAYKRIVTGWKATPRAAARSANPARPQSAQRPEAKAHAGPASRNRPKIAFHILYRKKVILPAILLLAAGFIFMQLPSFFSNSLPLDSSLSNSSLPNSSLSNKAADTETTVPQNAEPSPGANNTNTEGPSEATAPQTSAHLTSPASPSDLPPALLQPQPTERSSFFTLGSTTSEVLSVQGTPSRVQGQTWIYGLSEVDFRNGRVSRFNNFDGSLRVQMQPVVSENTDTPDHITIGSGKEEVLLVQGTPTRVEGNRWFYGFAELVFKNGRVAEYDNYFGALKMRILPSTPSGSEPPPNFTIGSTPDEVLAVQGTPTAIHGNRWSFDFSSVLFQNGKVISVINSEGALRYK
ncbi:hypothetical protein SBDP1_1040047 [Syntrophobacter sp. SbD1]|nr:hypothetical protein SBDP1_1040047 [Syntrophobacter sp. SbD1]